MKRLFLSLLTTDDCELMTRLSYLETGNLPLAASDMAITAMIVTARTPHNASNYPSPMAKMAAADPLPQLPLWSPLQLLRLFAAVPRAEHEKLQKTAEGLAAIKLADVIAAAISAKGFPVFAAAVNIMKTAAAAANKTVVEKRQNHICLTSTTTFC